MKLTVWILSHKWEDDDSINLYPSHDAAEEAIQAYVHDQWNEGNMDDCEYPGDPAEAVAQYFCQHEDYEWYSVYSQHVDFPHLPDIPDEDVILTANECAAVVVALDHTKYGDIVAALGVGGKEASEIVDSAYNKLKD
jgi:hypothetical protein